MPGSSRTSSPTPGSLLAGVDLVTFDCFGTLIDWQQALPGLGVELARMPVFLRESDRRQRPAKRDAEFQTYRTILEEVGAVLRPELPAEEIERWARRFGELPFFDDVRAGIGLLSSVVDIGVISNCDAIHQLDVTRRLGRPWDVCVVAEELRAYKPLDRAWDRAVALVQDRGYDRERWLHVSAWDDYDLAPACARGVRTVFMERPGGVVPQSGGVDLTLPDVLALAHAIGDAKGGPLAYEVDAEAHDEQTLERYLTWIETEHLAEVRACAGVRRAELIRLDGLRARTSYRFESRFAYARYLERDAPRLRARGRELFREDEVSMSRIEGTVRHVM
jgi:FMN phosphatase YigB (HAD superfamily)